MNKTGDILVVVDMQPGFPASGHRPTLRNVRREITRAMADHCFIIFLELRSRDFGPTRKSLLALVKGYSDCRVVEKCDNDGSYDVTKTYQKNNWTPTGFRVVGVNKAACVSSTAISLAQQIPSIVTTIIDDAAYGIEGGEVTNTYSWDKEFWTGFCKRHDMTYALDHFRNLPPVPSNLFVN